LAPISFGPIQIRVADALIPLAAIFGWPVVVGAGLGCLAANAYYSLGWIDVILGPLANLVSAYLVFILRRRLFIACTLGALPIGFIVGGYLWLLLPPPSVFGLDLPSWAAMIVSITSSTLLATAGLGYLLLKTMARKEILEPLKLRGLRIYQ